MKNTTKRNRPVRVPKPSPTPNRNTHRNLNTLIVIVLAAIVLLSVIAGIFLANNGKEYRLSRQQREANRSLRDLQDSINNVPDDPRWLSYNYNDSMFYNDAEELFNDDAPATPLEHEVTPVDEDYQRKIDEIGTDVLNFINETYHMDWNYVSVPTYFYFDMTEILGKYYPTENILAFNENGMFPVHDLSHVTVFAIAAHELVHYLMKYNIGTPFCMLYNADGKSTGVFLHEAIVEKLTFDYLESKGIYPLQIHAGEAISSAYELLLYNLEAFEMIFGCNIVECMLTQNHEAPATILEDVTGDKEAYARWLYWLDNSMFAMWDGNHEVAMHDQGVLNQFYCWAMAMDENTDVEKEFTELTNYYLLRCYFIKTHLTSKEQCIGAWFILANIEYDSRMQQLELQEFLENFDS